MIHKLWHAARGTRRDRVDKGSSRRPGLEALEDRCVPATLTWVGPAGGTWSTAANWYPAAVPNSSSSLQFGTTFGGTTNSSTDDMPSLSIGALDVDSTYGTTTQLTLNQSLTVTSEVLQSGGTIATESASQDLTLAIGSTFNWYGGALLGNGTLIIAGEGANKFHPRTVANFNVDGYTPANGGSLLGINVLNQGDLNWQDSADIYMYNNAVLSNGASATNNTGIISISSAAGAQAGLTIHLLDETGVGPGSYFVNHYNASINVGTTGSVYIGIGDYTPNVNNYNLTLTEGNLEFGPAAPGSMNDAFDNGGLVSDNSGSGSVLQYDLPFVQLSDTDKPANTPQVKQITSNLTENFDAGVTLNLGYFYCANGASVNVTGDMDIGASAIVYAYSTTAGLTVSQNINDYGVMNVQNGDVTITSPTGAFNNYSTASPNGGLFESTNSIINASVVNDEGLATFGLGSTINGSYTQIDGTTDCIILTVTGTGAGMGVFNEQGGTVILGNNATGSLTATAGCIIGAASGSVPSTFDVTFGSSITGNVTENPNGTIEFTGLYTNLKVVGNYTQFGILDVTVTSPGYGQQYCNAVVVTGNADLKPLSVINIAGAGNVPPGGYFTPIEMSANGGSTEGTVTNEGVIIDPNYAITILSGYPNNIYNLDNGLWFFF
jgi:hypothetical protein